MAHVMSKNENGRQAGRASGVQTLARWTLAIDSSDVPSACIDQAKLLLLDSIGCAIAGREEAVCRNIVAVCEDVGGGPCTIIGGSRKVDMAHAVLANGALVRVLDLSDYVIGEGMRGPEIGGHPSDNIAVALAAGEARRCLGRDILAAIVIGYEVYGRLKSLMDRSGPWDGVSLSAFVAPVIAGRLMGLDADRLAHALALSGIRAAAPALVRRGGISAAKSIANALIAQGAVEATLLAERGVTGPLEVLEHERGLRSVFPKGDILERLSAAFPERSYIMRSNVKVYPCLATGQAAVAAALDVRKALGGNAADVRDIDIVMADYPFIRDQQDDPGRIRPQSREAADHSFQYLVAVALMDGAFGPAQFDGERWLDPQTVALMAKIRTSVDPTLNVRAPNTYPCVVRVRDEKGREHVSEVSSPPGTSRGGIAEQDVVDKFHAVAAALDRSRREVIVSAVLGLDRAMSADSLIAALRM